MTKSNPFDKAKQAQIAAEANSEDSTDAEVNEGAQAARDNAVDADTTTETAETAASETDALGRVKTQDDAELRQLEANETIRSQREASEAEHARVQDEKNQALAEEIKAGSPIDDELAALSPGTVTAEPVKVAVDTADEELRVGVVGSVDQALDADTVIIHPEDSDKDPKSLEEFVEENTDVTGADEAENEDKVTYSIHPLQKWKMGDYQFTDGRLSITQAEVEDFETLLKAQPAVDQARVQKLDRANADAMVNSILKGRMSQGVDTTANTIRSGDKV